MYLLLTHIQDASVYPQVSCRQVQITFKPIQQGLDQKEKKDKKKKTSMA